MRKRWLDGLIVVGLAVALCLVAARFLGRQALTEGRSRAQANGALHAKRLKLGIWVDQNFGDTERRTIGLDAGVGFKIAEVDKESVCARAGIRGGDILLSINGEPVKESTLASLLDKLSPDHDVEFVILRHYEKETHKAKLAESDFVDLPTQSGIGDEKAKEQR